MQWRIQFQMNSVILHLICGDKNTDVSFKSSLIWITHLYGNNAQWKERKHSETKLINDWNYCSGSVSTCLLCVLFVLLRLLAEDRFLCRWQWHFLHVFKISKDVSWSSLRKTRCFLLVTLSRKLWGSRLNYLNHDLLYS